MLSCRQATELMSQANERSLGLRERLGLRLHLLFCAGCAEFQRQLAFMSRSFARLRGEETKQQ